ncbi:MAG TPA: tripartite tricarboxylate transporter substrate-binding protein [Candidatus Binatia bacterium]|nr:tripartite tricarboxylate transporter substrate-binding protein [Candidatus Binatia bacterium]
MMRRTWIVSVLLSFSMIPLIVSPAPAQAPFYEGKTITIVIGTAAGGSIVAARIIAQYLGKYLPGNPTVVVQSMLGGAHIVASNHVFNTAKPDGLTLLAANPNIAIAQLIKVEGVRFDVRKFEWLGSSGSDGVLLTIRSDLPYKSFEEMRKADRELVVGTTGPGSNAHDFPLLLKEFAGAKFKFVSGYPANSDILLALERKEVDVWAAFAATVRPVAQRGAVRPLVRARVSSPGFDDLPVDETLTTSPVGKALMSIKTAPLAIGRPLAAPPGTPADRVALLRDAIAKALKDPELEASGRKAQIDFKHIAADEVHKGISAILQQPADVRQEMVKYIKFGG